MQVLKHPLPGPVINVLRNVAREQGQIVIEVELHPCPNAERGEDGGEKQQCVQPVTPFGRLDYNNSDFLAFRIVDLVFKRRGGIVRHLKLISPPDLLQSMDCNSFPGLKRTALPGGMLTSAPVRGLRPIPVLRGRTLKTPKPRSSIRSPWDSAFFMLSKTVSTASSALVLVMPVLVTTSLMISSLITFQLSL